MNDIITILKNTGAIITGGHFVGTSLLHFDTYVNKDFLYPHTTETKEVCGFFAKKFKDSDIDVVVGPALGGIILSQWTAHQLSEMCDREVLAIYTEKSSEGGQVFTRGYENFVKGKRVLLVEDVITTGQSLLKSAKAVKDAGGEIVSTCAMVNKNKNIIGHIEDLPFFSLCDLFIETYQPDECLLCKNKIPIDTKLGHGKKFLAEQK